MVHSHAVRRPLGALSAELVRHVWHRHLTPSLAALAAQEKAEQLHAEMVSAYSIPPEVHASPHARYQD